MDQWIWIIDFHGFTLRDCDPRSATMAIDLLQHYPERLFRVIFLDAPFIFGALWSAIRSVLDERTAGKVCALCWGGRNWGWNGGEVSGNPGTEPRGREEERGRGSGTDGRTRGTKAVESDPAPAPAAHAPATAPAPTPALDCALGGRWSL